MEITATPEQIDQLWSAARVATDKSSDYAEGAYDMIQALTGSADVDDVLDNLEDRR